MLARASQLKHLADNFEELLQRTVRAEHGHEAAIGAETDATDSARGARP
jgi:hypothetical protein